ncbi:MAG TPA: tetratricopeptide repeat protein, partial [Pyrinomonadaceae bacterium]
MSGLTICERRQLFLVRLSSMLLLLFLLAVPPTVYTQSNTSPSGPVVTQPASIPSLELGKPIEREITGGEVHSYNLTLAVDQYVQFAVDQRGIDLAVWTFDPNGKRISEVDAFRVGEQEGVALLAEVSGAYRIELHTSFPKGPTGRYEIKLTELRPATERDKISYRAGVLIAHAFELERKQTKDDWQKAIQKYEEALPLWHSINDIDWEINTLYQIASAYISLAEKQKAFDFANRAVALAESAVKDPNEEKRNSALKLQAWALDTLGRAHYEFDDRKKSVALYNQSLLIRKQINDRAGTIITLNLLAISYQSMGDPRNALVCLTEIRELLKDTGDRAKESSFLNNICVVYENLAEYAKALEACNQSLSIRRALNDERGTAPVLNS